MSHLREHELRAGCAGPLRIFGTQLFLHWSAPLMLVLVGIGAPTRAMGLLVVWLVHTLGHVWALRGLGARAHGVRVNGLGGECAWDATLGHSGLAVVAWSGVAAQGVLLICWVAVRVVTGFAGGPLWAGLDDALLLANAGLIVLNLLPLSGLDGADAWSLLLSPKVEVRRPPRPPARPDPEELRRRAETERIFAKMLDELLPSSSVDRRDDED